MCRGRRSKLGGASGGCGSNTLQKKLKELEDENLSLRSEVNTYLKLYASKANGHTYRKTITHRLVMFSIELIVCVCVCV